MENAVDALKMAFAIFVLILAISVSIISFNMAKAASDVILYSKDKTNFYEYQGDLGRKSEKRIVGLETVIPTLYRYYKENYTVVFKIGYGYNEETGQFQEVDYLNLYDTTTNSDLWSDSYEPLIENKYGISKVKQYSKKNIFSFDLDEEILRYEPWTGSTERIKLNLDAFLNGSSYTSPVDNEIIINYSNTKYLSLGGFIGKYKKAKFVESVGNYTYSAKNTTDEENSLASLTKEKEKRVIIFTLISESIH